MPEPLRLNLGAGPHPLPGYVAVDRKTGGEIYPLVYPDASADVVRASHCLEHLSHRDTLAALADWVRVLKPGGVLKVAVPDFDYIVCEHASGNPDGLPLEGYLMGGHVDADDRHGSIFTDLKLRRMMEAVGLTGLSRWASELPDCASLPVSLNLQGTKPAAPAEPAAPPKIAAVMSMPRLAFSDNLHCAVNVLGGAGIALTKVTGAYWGQCLERGIERHLDDGTDWVLTVDYDTAFTRGQFARLVKLAMTHPEADAIAPVQVKREEGGAMVSLPPENKIAGELVKADTAHFGLTLLRVAALRRLPRPWFIAKPDADGRWGEGRTDEDVGFWEKWAAAGNSLYLAARVPVGHLQLVVTWPGKDYTPVHQYAGDFAANGRPAGILG